MKRICDFRNETNMGSVVCKVLAIVAFVKVVKVKICKIVNGKIVIRKPNIQDGIFRRFSYI